MANVAEHRVEMPVVPAAAGKAAATLPEKWLNHFVRVVASMERFGNALGTLAFTWATVVLLGGYPTVLRPKLDFTFAAIIIFLEALRMFSRNNRLDYQLFFRTRGALSWSLGSNGLAWFVCISNVMACMVMSIRLVPMFGAILVTGPLMCLRPARVLIPNPLRRALSLWSPVVAVLLLYPPTFYSLDEDDPPTFYSLAEDGDTQKLSFKVTTRTAYLILLVSVLLLTISRLQFPSIIKVVDWALSRKIVFWRPVIQDMSMVAAIVMLMFTFHGILTKVSFFTLNIMILMAVSLGNLQIPAAALRIGLAMSGLLEAKDHYSDHGDGKANLGDMTNLVPTLIIFYGMVLGQGTLYIVASIIEIFSFIPRRSLMSRAGFRSCAGVKYVNLYYAYALEKCMEGAVLAPVKTSLVTFAMHSLRSDSTKMQLYGLKILHIFLQKEHLKTKAISELTTSPETVACLVNMLGWTSEGDKDIRSFAAKVIAEVADNLQVVHVPGAMQLIASLLDTVDVQEIKYPLLYIGILEPKQDNLIQKVSRSFLQKKVSRNEQTSPMLKWLKKMARYCFIPREDPNMDEQKPHILRFWKWSAPEEEPSTDVDLLPVLAMLILDKLASFDLQSCIEIYRETALISKIIEFTINIVDMTNINETKVLLKGSSLKLLRRLSSTKGKFGVTLRQKISEHPFLLSHLAEILDDNVNSQEIRELTIELLRNLAMDINIKEEIGHMPVIISKLMHEFLSQGAPSTTDSGQLLRMISGQALAVLSMDSANNCLAMLAETGYLFIKVLTVMIHSDRYKYVASSLLLNICVNARSELGNSDMKEISSILREVLERIMDAEGAELEVLVGLSSQICDAIPHDFARELEHGQIKERFIKRLVHALTSNMTPTAHCPGIRRVIVEHTINMMECEPGYTNCFKKYRMMEALLRVERTPSKAENYKFLLGDAGLIKHSIPVSALVSRAKELMSIE